MFRERPKAELHIHLEGSLSDRFWAQRDPRLFNAITSFSQQAGRSLPSFLICMEQIHRCLSTPQSYGEACSDLLDALITDNVSYVELTWGAGGIVEFHGRDPGDVLQYIDKAVDERSKYIEAKILIDLIRNQPFELCRDIVSWLEGERPKRVVGVNVGGDEARFPIGPMAPLLARCRDAGFGVSIHAGESTEEGSLLEAIAEIQPDRVGHGTSLHSPRGVALIRELNIHLEACPTSNVQLGYLARSGEHPLLCNSGIRGSINTDDRSFFSPSLTDELADLHLSGAVSLSKIALCQVQAVQDAFQTESSPFRKAILAAWSADSSVGGAGN